MSDFNFKKTGSVSPSVITASLWRRNKKNVRFFRVTTNVLRFSGFLFRLFSYSVEYQKNPRIEPGVTCFIMQTRFISKVQYMTTNETLK